MTRGGSVVVIALSYLITATPVHAQGRWTVWVDDRDVTVLATPRAAGSGIFVDVRALAPALGLTIDIRPDGILVRTPDGTEWTGRETSMELYAHGQSMRLPSPIVGIGDALYIDVHSAAQLSGLALRLRPEELRVEFVTPDAAEFPAAEPPPAFVGPPRAFRIAKTPDEIAAGRHLDPEDALHAEEAAGASVLPRRHDRFTLGTAVGYVPGKDGATEVTGSGQIHGFEGDMNAFVTLGDRGPEWYYGRLAVRDHDSHRSLVAGDMVSETRGLSRGAIFSWEGKGGRKPAVALYRLRFPRDGDRTVVSYRDQLVISRRLLAEGEVSTDRSLVAKVRLNTRRVNAETYHHRGPFERDLGGTVAVDLWRGVGVGGATRTSQGSAFTERFEQAYLRVPLWRGASVRMERNRVKLSANESKSNVAVLTLPMGPVHLLARWQDRDMETFSQYGQRRVAERGLLAAASYAPTARVRLNLQIANEWLHDGRVRDFQEVNAHVQLTSGSTLQATAAITDVEAIDRVRLRLSQRLRADLSLVAEFGRFSAFQAPLVASEAFPSRFKVFVRKDWGVTTPARGGHVTGRVRDQLGSPVAGVVVRLGRYRTTTSTSGIYAFDRVPRGVYPLSIDRDHLPASYGMSEGERHVTVQPRARATEDFVLAPLHAIHGRVYVDGNDNGQIDTGEELGGVVLRIGEKLTRSGIDGSYAFYNLAPGAYMVEVLEDRLPPDHELRTPRATEVRLDAGRPAKAPDVRLVPKRKPIVFQQSNGRR